MAQVKAQLNGLRIAPRKVRAVANLIKGKDVIKALDQLNYLVRRPVTSVRKLLNSAIANAENNFHMVKENLYIKQLIVDEGTKLKRFRPKGFGRASMIQKKTSHLIVLLEERTPGLRQEKKARVKKEEIAEQTLREETKMRDAKRPEIKREIGSKGSLFGNLGKKLFQRKAI